MSSSEDTRGAIGSEQPVTSCVTPQPIVIQNASPVQEEIDCKIVRGLGVTQFVLASVIFLLNLSGLVLYFVVFEEQDDWCCAEGKPYKTATGMWAAVFFVASGTLSLHATKNKRCILHATAVCSFLSLLTALAIVGVAAWAIVNDSKRIKFTVEDLNQANERFRRDLDISEYGFAVDYPLKRDGERGTWAYPSRVTTYPTTPYVSYDITETDYPDYDDDYDDSYGVHKQNYDDDENQDFDYTTTPMPNDYDLKLAEAIIGLLVSVGFLATGFAQFVVCLRCFVRCAKAVTCAIGSGPGNCAPGTFLQVVDMEGQPIAGAQIIRVSESGRQPVSGLGSNSDPDTKWSCIISCVRKSYRGSKNEGGGRLLASE